MKLKAINQEQKESSDKDDESASSKDKKLDLDYMDWIFDKGWLRTKK